MEITICVGSSCHLKGSYKVIKQLKRLIEANGLEDRVTLKASFCMERCTQGVSAALDGKPINCLTVDNVEDFFYEHIKGVIDS